MSILTSEQKRMNNNNGKQMQTFNRAYRFFRFYAKRSVARYCHDKLSVFIAYLLYHVAIEPKKY